MFRKCWKTFQGFESRQNRCHLFFFIFTLRLQIWHVYHRELLLQRPCIGSRLKIKFSLSMFDCLNIGNPNHYKMYHTKFFKRHRNIHCWRIDKSEKENIGSELLVRVKFWLPVIIIRMESNRNIILIVKFHNIGPFLYIFRYKCSQGFIKRRWTLKLYLLEFLNTCN